MGEIRYKEGELIIECNARSLDDKNLDILADETISLFELGGFSVQKADYHGAWKPDIAKFALLTKDIMSKYYKNVQLKAIHAGLECGALIQTQAKKIEAASIGPTIKYPHSLYEECDLNSVERIAYAVENIIQEVTK
jgi:dipeptidase D